MVPVRQDRPVSCGRVVATPQWWNGIHRGLKIPRRKDCGFESHLRYMIIFGILGSFVTGAAAAFAGLWAWLVWEFHGRRR